MKRIKVFSVLLAIFVLVASVFFVSEGNAYIGSPVSHASRGSVCRSGCQKKVAPKNTCRSGCRKKAALKAPRMHPKKTCRRGCARRPSPRPKCSRCR